MGNSKNLFTQSGPTRISSNLHPYARHRTLPLQKIAKSTPIQDAGTSLSLSDNLAVTHALLTIDRTKVNKNENYLI